MKNAWQSLAPLFVVLIASGRGVVGMLTIGGIGFVIAITLYSLLSYWFFRFQISANSILIRQGVIKKKQLDIKFDRIQGINAQQNPLYRFLGLVTISFDTAGSAGSEGALPAVTRGFADSLRERIGKPPIGQAADSDISDTGAVTLVRLDWRDMIRIGLADRRGLILFALISPLFEQLGDRIENFITEFVKLAAASGQLELNSFAERLDKSTPASWLHEPVPDVPNQIPVVNDSADKPEEGLKDGGAAPKSN